MSNSNTFMALDQDDRDLARKRIKLYDLIDRLQNHVKNPVAYPMSKTQLQAADILLRKAIPDLKAVEHSKAPTRELTREELIAKLSGIHARTTGEPQQRRVDGAGAADGAAEVRH